jgi:hypothetical protein
VLAGALSDLRMRLTLTLTGKALGVGDLSKDLGALSLGQMRPMRSI